MMSARRSCIVEVPRRGVISRRSELILLKRSNGLASISSCSRGSQDPGTP